MEAVARTYTLERLSEELDINYSTLKKQADRLNDRGEMLNRYGKSDEVQPDDLEMLILSYADRIERAAVLAHKIGINPEPSPAQQPKPESRPAPPPPKITTQQPKPESRPAPPPPKITTQQPKPESRPGKNVSQANPGEAISGNKVFKFISAVVFIGAQGWIFADLASRVIPQIGNVPMIAEFIVGFLFEATAIVIALNLPADKMIFDDLPVRNLWMGIFFPVQILTVFCWAQIFGPEMSDGIGKVVVALSVPIGILAYSNLYFKDKQNDKK